MVSDQKDRFIQYLAEQHQEDELTKKAMRLVLEDFMAEQKLIDEKFAVMEARQSDGALCRTQVEVQMGIFLGRRASPEFLQALAYKV